MTVQRFKSLDTGPVSLAPLTVLFGPNAAGKSNFLDAVQVLSRTAAERTLADALGGPLRGRPVEAFGFPEDGLPGLLSQSKASFALGADLDSAGSRYRYRVEVAIRPSSGALTAEDEYLTLLGRGDQPKGEPRIEREGTQFLVRQKSKPGRPSKHQVGQSYTQLSDPRHSGAEYRHIERVREELSSWRTYYLDPRVAMRSPQAPQEVSDIGSLGEHIAPFLYRLKEEQPRAFAAVVRTLRALIPSVENLSVDLDKRRGVLDLEVKQNGIAFSSRIISEGTLRVLALICVSINPWGGSLIAFEEPENGVHPRRIQLIASMLGGRAAEGGRQVLITTHSPVFCAAVYREARNKPSEIAIYRVFREGRTTRLSRLDPVGPLFANSEITRGLSAPTEDGVFEGLAIRGLLDE